MSSAFGLAVSINQLTTINLMAFPLHMTDLGFVHLLKSGSSHFAEAVGLLQILLLLHFARALLLLFDVEVDDDSDNNCQNYKNSTH